MTLKNLFDGVFGHIVGSRAFVYPKAQEVVAATTAVTWDPDNKSSNISLSTDKLTADNESTAGTTYEGTFATLGRSSGKYYFEVVANHSSSYSGYQQIGVQDGTIGLNDSLGGAAGGWGYRSLQGRLYNNGSYVIPSNYPVQFTTNEVVGIAIDLDAGKLWWSLNGVWLYKTGSFPSPDPATGTDPAYSNLSGTIYPAICLRQVDNNFTGIFKLADFNYTPPTGFSAWES